MNHWLRNRKIKLLNEILAKYPNERDCAVWYPAIKHIDLSGMDGIKIDCMASHSGFMWVAFTEENNATSDIQSEA